VMSAFVIFCAAMVLAAIVAVVYPLVRPVPTTTKGEPVLAKSSAVALMLALALPISAALVYAGVSNFPWSSPTSAAAVPPGHGTAGDAGTMAEVTATLEARLASNPDDADGWRMLGRTYLISGEAGKAVTAYEKAVKIFGTRNPGLEMDLAEAMVLTDDPALQSRAGEIVAATLAEDSNNQKALWYGGVMAVRANDTETAKGNWMKLIEQNPPPEIREMIVSQLAELGVVVPPGEAPAAAPVMAAAGPAMGGGSMGGGAMGGGSMGGDAAAPRGRTIRVAVSIDPALQAKLKPGVPLFVAARQPGIPGPPIAAVRVTLDQLPMTVTLSDANTMIEGRDLSSVDDVEVVARVAFGGTAVIASGDLIGSSVQKKGSSADLGVVISKIQP
jgi:cytochrome c-type biogenesis protein CcmH